MTDHYPVPGSLPVTKLNPELLAPAGSAEAFYAAVNAGADAVYMAGTRFGARAYADNFGDGDLIECVRAAHARGVRIHLTVNTLTRQSETADLLRFLEPLAAEGLDAVIVQDLGVISLIRSTFPDIAIHASTQLSVTMEESARLLASLGVTRVVPARELSLGEIIRLKKKLPIEVETFIHGAMCYSYSGKCLFSSMIGGRSGNRGRCAQPCRLPYAVLSGDASAQAPFGRALSGAPEYPLSMRDQCALSLLPELIGAGIDSFKIEGRMKQAEYVGGVTSVYRGAIDRYLKLRRENREKEWHPEPDELEVLEGLYIRSERSDGYYHRRNGREMITLGLPGYRGADEGQRSRIADKFIHAPAPRNLTAEVTLIPGEPARMYVRLGETESSAEGAEVQSAVKRPLGKDDVIRQITRGETSGYAVRSAEVIMPEPVFLPVSALNDLRRKALAAFAEKAGEKLRMENGEALRRKRSELLAAIGSGGEMPQEGHCGPEKGQSGPEEAGSSPVRAKAENPGLPGGIWALVFTRGQAEAAARAGAAVLVDESGSFALGRSAADPEGEAAGQGAGITDPAGRRIPVLAAFPPAARESGRNFMEEAAERTGRGEYDGAFVRTLEQLYFCFGRGIPAFADESVYCWNRETAGLLGRYLCGAAYPAELSLKEWEAVFGESGTEDFLTMLTVYGRTPLMVSANCVYMTSGRCTGGRKGFSFAALKDRTGAVLPCLVDCTHCLNVIYNALPLSLYPQSGRYSGPDADVKLLRFTTELPEEAEEITALFARLFGEGHRDEDVPGQAEVRGVNAPGTYTRGRSRRGAE